MGDVLEETPSSQDDSQPINPTPEHREVTNQARIASAIQNANDRDITDRRHPEKASDKAAQIIQDLCLRVQELEGKITNKGKHNDEHGSHATSRSRSRRGRSPTRRHDRRDGRSSSRDHRHGKSPERRYNKKHNRSASQDLSYQHHSDEDRRNRNTKRTRNDHTIMGATPFTERILRAKLPKGFDKPTDMKYDGTKDPQEHLTAFEARMNLEGAADAVRCRAFPVTLAGPAIKWFNALPNGSIASFHDITRKFMAQFTTRITKAKHPISLLGVTQKQEESTRKYLDRFNDECLTIDGLTDSVASLCLTNGLMNEDFRKHLTTRPVWTMHEIQNVAKDYINDEEVSQVVAANKRQHGNNQRGNSASHHNATPKENQRDHPRPTNRTPRIGKFSNYTPLTAPITEIYHQIADRGIIPKARQLKERTGGNKTLYCEYHRGYGHKTQDCFDLKDALEQAIRDGKLPEFTKIIREPRRAERDRSPEREGRNPRTQKRPPRESPEEDPTIIVNVITGKDAPCKSKSKIKKDLQVMAVTNQAPTPVSNKAITFLPEDCQHGTAAEDAPFVISAKIGTGLVRRILVDTGADSNILFRGAFDKLGLRDENLQTHRNGVTGLGDNFLKPEGSITLPLTIGTGDKRRTLIAEFVVLKDSTAYNVILGRKTINDFSAIIFTKYLLMKFVAEDDSIGTIHGDREIATECDNTSLALRKKSRDAAGIFLADLDARQDGQPRPEPEGDMEKLQIGQTKDEYTFINRNLPYDLKEDLSQFLKQNRDLFAFTQADMPGIDPDFMSHRLAVKPKAKPVAQRRRKMSADRAAEVKRQVQALLEANFIRELPYTTWLANVVLVKKSNGKWRMCVDYTDLNKACPKDAFPLPNIDGLVDSASGHRYLSFMDAYSGYNQIPMHRPDEEKTAFITPDGTYCYTVMPFGLKNAGATYQRLVNKIFQNLSGTKLEVYIDDMLAKTDSDEQLISDLKAVTDTLRRHQMRLNPTKCAFGMEAGKFLGFMITQRGVEANPEKRRAVLETTSPKNLRDVQKLTGRLTALSRFLGASAQKAIPFFKLMKKGAPFVWKEECEVAFQHFKKTLAEPPILAKPQTGETLYLYLSITEETLAAALIRENKKKEQKPIYFTSKVLQDAETRYSRLEKLAFALLTASRRLRQYFQAHPITVRTDQAVKQVLQKPDLAGRMLAWSVELSQFDIKFEPRYAIKAQAMADFIAKMTPGNIPPEAWKLHVDGSSNLTSGGAGVILESQNGVVIEQSVRYDFPVSNNQAEYEALLAGLTLASEVGAKILEINTDSQVVSSQINGDYQTRDPLLQQYLAKVNKLKEEFDQIIIQHVPMERNARADLLSKLASTKPGHGNKSLIQEVVKTPSVSLTADTHLTHSHHKSWTHPILQYLLNRELPEDPKEGKRIKREAAGYTVVAGQLYKCGLSQPLLKCVEPGSTEYILREIHEGCCGHHVGGKTLAQKVIRAGYFWHTIIRDSMQLVKNCDKCQRHANIHQAAPHQLSIISAERPFGTWGIDLVGPFPTAPGQLRYLIVAIDYFTKWIEAEPLASITAIQCRKFLWRQIITRFGIPEIIISDNGTQFADTKFKEFLNGLRISHHFSSVEHPQTNGQVESANKIIVKGLKKRLDEAKGLWADELRSVLWSYRTTPQTATGETPFRLTYGTEAIIPVEIGDPSPRRTIGGNDEEAERDLTGEIRSIAHLRELALKQRISLRYNHGVIRREFTTDDLVLRRNDIGPPTPGEGKLAPNWEGPYRIKAAIGKGAYKLERLNGNEVPRTWNAANLRRYYS
ncbi:hypothetical protein Ahy_B10g101409 [Arachis hypogaea]|uniref:Uncharacterized protein n=1 Tax=Arachis hypogaea TaxID=3818 RepID=A0A444WZG4_ARAHY|nr:hypothetical protein Ahy_B10g101409 [Arachis hypogaea]